MKTPRKLYKFRTFNVRTLRLITDSETFYADPSEFNDPMDCDPIIEIDLATSELGKVYLAMVGRDRESEAKQKLLNHIYNANEHGLAKKSAERQKYLSAAIAVDLEHFSINLDRIRRN